MGLTYEDAKEIDKSLGTDLASIHPDRPLGRVKHSTSARGRNKYGAVRTEYAGRTYDSKAEANHAKVLDSERSCGLIRNWTPQVAFHLGCPENTYVVDFVVERLDGSTEAHEVKGRRTAKANHDFRLWERYGQYPLKVFRDGNLDRIINPHPTSETIHS